MTDLWGFLLQTLTASLTALLLLALKGLFADKLSPRWQYGVWGVLALRLLIPAGLGRRQVLLPLAQWLEYARLTVESRLDSALADPWTPIHITAPVPLAALTPPASVTDWLFLLYAAGVLAWGLWFLACYVRLRRGLTAAAGPERTAQVERVCLRYGLLPPIRVAESARAESAFVCGPLRPVLVLPAGRPVDDKVLLHELLHLKYGDLWLNTLLCVFRCLHWCNPFLWRVFDRVGNDGEALCDQRVLERLEGEERRDYGRILLDMAADRFARVPGTSSMANGSRNIAARIQSIARFKRFPRGMALVSLCIAVALGAACLWGVPALAVELPDRAPGGLERAMAAARVNRPTTLAGALDTYAKGLLYNNGIYLACVSTPEEQQALFRRMQAAPEGQAPGFLDGGLEGWAADTLYLTGSGSSLYAVANLAPTEEGWACWMLFSRATEKTISDPSRADLLYLHRLEITRTGREGWVVEASEVRREEDFPNLYQDEALLALPGYDYSARTEDWLAQSHLITLHHIDNALPADSSALFSQPSFQPQPQLNAAFDSVSLEYRHRVERLGADGAGRPLAINGVSLYAGWDAGDLEVLAEQLPDFFRDNTSYWGPTGAWAASSSDCLSVLETGEGATLSPGQFRLPQAIAVRVWLGDQAQDTLILTPEVTP